MAITTSTEAYWDPYDEAMFADPYPAYQRLRDEAPIYRNEPHDFYAVSRFDDVKQVLGDRELFLSCRGDILEMVQSGADYPPGTLVFEEPPEHTIHRRLLSRVFTPMRMFELEPAVRGFCRSRLESLAQRGRFDFVTDIGAHVPMRVIGMLLGIPESDQEAIRDAFYDDIRADAGGHHEESGLLNGDLFNDYIDWRYEHPSDDLTTALINAEFEDEKGAVCRLTRREVKSYVTVLAGAGNETTNLLIGWIGKLLGEHPDARRDLVNDRSLVPNAIEEILRYEANVQVVARYVGRDVELHGQIVQGGNAILAIQGSGNRDERAFPDADRFDIHRKIGQHLTFGHGPHFCLGAALARVEGRVVLDEVLKYFPDWEVDLENAEFLPVAKGNNRGWGKMPVVIG